LALVTLFTKAPNEISTMRAKGWLTKESSHEFVRVNLMRKEADLKWIFRRCPSLQSICFLFFSTQCILYYLVNPPLHSSSSRFECKPLLFFKLSHWLRLFLLKLKCLEENSFSNILKKNSIFYLSSPL